MARDAGKPWKSSYIGRGMKLLHLEDDPTDILLLQAICLHEESDCELTPAMDRDAFIAGLQSGRYEGILSDSGVFNLDGPEAVALARSMAPGLPYVFLCGMMTDARREALMRASPEGMFSKDDPSGFTQAVHLLRQRCRKTGGA